MRQYYVNTQTGIQYRTMKRAPTFLEMKILGKWVVAPSRHVNLPSTMNNFVPQTHPVIKWTILIVVTLSVIISLGATL